MALVLASIGQLTKISLPFCFIHYFFFSLKFGFIDILLIGGVFGIMLLVLVLFVVLLDSVIHI